jgi:prepilin-type processing-associated H-X9-DG protein
MYDYNLFNGINNITDGLSNTFAKGEGAGGAHWKLCGSENGLDRDLYPCNRPDEMNPIAAYTNQAAQPWLPGQVNSDPYPLIGLKVTSLLGCTAEALNKNPVTATLANRYALSITIDPNSCNSGQSPNPPYPPHRTSNFRSDHPGGAHFLFADGSVQFIPEAINHLISYPGGGPLVGGVYQALSTRAGGEPNTNFE